ncbi:Uncharacterised protein [uncultured archaeon]|nr:Uncharacterised protein [uncultured archaeon]
MAGPNPYSINNGVSQRLEKSSQLLGSAAVAEGLRTGTIPQSVRTCLEKLTANLARRNGRMKVQIENWDWAQGMEQDALSVKMDEMWSRERGKAKAFLLKMLPEIKEQISLLSADNEAQAKCLQAFGLLLSEHYKATYFLRLGSVRTGLMKDMDVMEEMQKLEKPGLKIDDLVGELMEVMGHGLRNQAGLFELLVGPGQQN